MSRRDESKRDRARAEEDALNKMLQDAGLYEEGMGLEEKRAMMELLEESRASAQQEAAEREQWRQQEEKILKDTLNKSFHENPEESAVGSSIQHDSEESSSDSDIVAIPSGKEGVKNGQPGDVSDSGSATPDVSPVRACSPELLPPSGGTGQGPDTGSEAASKGKIGKKAVREKPRGNSQNSEEDLFCDSQSSAQAESRPNYQECVVSDSKSSGKNDPKSPPCTPGRGRSVQQTVTVVRSVEKRTVTVECSTSKPSGSQQSLKRRYSVEEVSESERSEPMVSSYSQPLFPSSQEKVRKSSQVSEDEDGIQLLSPVIGKRIASATGSTTVNSKIYSKSVQDAEISNSIDPKPVQQLDAVMVEDSDEEEDFLLPTPSVSQSVNPNQMEKRSSTPDGCDSKKSQEAGSSKQTLQKANINGKTTENNEEKRNEVDCSADSQSPRLKLGKPAVGAISHNLDMISDSDEDQSFNYHNDRKRNVNVFWSQEEADIPLKRRRKLTQEVRSGSFFRSSRETLDDCFKRILTIINEDMQRLQQNQSTLSYRLKWMPPVVVDKRVKDSIDRPGAANSKKKNVEPLETPLPRRTLRHTPRQVEMQEEDSHNSEDSLPDIFPREEQSLVSQNKRILKRRNLHQGLSQKRAKLATLLEDKQAGQSWENSKRGGDSGEDFDSNSQFPVGGEEGGFLSVTKPKKTFQEVSSSKSAGTRNSTSDSDSENVCIVTQVSDEECTMMEKPASSVEENLEIEQATTSQHTPKVTPQVRPQKRPMRNSFILKPQDNNSEDRDCDSATSSTRQEKASSDIRAQTTFLDKPSTSGIQRSEMKTPRGRARPTPQSNRMRPLNFVSSSGNDLESQRKQDRDVEAGPSSNTDVCILDDDDDDNTATTTTSKSSQNVRNQVNRPGLAKREPTGRLQIRPAPLKLKKNNARGKGGEGVIGGQEEKERNAEQITSSIAVQRQVPNGQSVADGKEQEEEKGNLVPCPLCGKLFSLKQIEVHASDCLEINETQEDHPIPSSSRQSKRNPPKQTQKGEECEDSEIVEVAEMRTDNCVVVAGRARTPPKKVRCTYCKVVMSEGDDYLIHVQSCVVKQQMEDAIMSPSSGNTPVSKSGFKRVGVPQKSGVPSARSVSLFDHLEGGLVCVSGDITAPEYSDPNTALVQILNCVAVRPHGLSEVLAKKYPYCDSYSRRKAVGTYNRARVEDRPVPGTLSVCRPKVPSQGPIVVNLYGQFYMGKEKNRNIMNKRLAKNLQNSGGPQDTTLLAGLSMDTSENRIKWFQEALDELVRKVEGEKIRHVVFPYSIGCGLAGGNWERNYLPAIQKFEKTVKGKGVTVTIVRKTEEQKSDSEIAVVATVRKTLGPTNNFQRGRGGLYGRNT